MTLDFDKYGGLMPVVIQDHITQKVLMVGFMNQEAYQKTRKEKKVTFYSRSRQTLWTKGETSGNYLYVKEMIEDCDHDTLLIKVEPVGPVCHTGSDTCFNEVNSLGIQFVDHLEGVIRDRHKNPSDKSYTSSLFAGGINKIAQKVGEEVIELIIESKDENRYLFLNESADLIYHFLVLLEAKGYTFNDVIEILESRHK